MNRQPAGTARASSTSRRPSAKKTAPVGTPAGSTDLRLKNGPPVVVDVEDGKVPAY